MWSVEESRIKKISYAPQKEQDVEKIVLKEREQFKPPVIQYPKLKRVSSHLRHLGYLKSLSQSQQILVPKITKMNVLPLMPFVEMVSFPSELPQNMDEEPYKDELIEVFKRRVDDDWTPAELTKKDFVKFGHYELCSECAQLKVTVKTESNVFLKPGEVQSKLYQMWATSLQDIQMVQSRKVVMPAMASKLEEEEVNELPDEQHTNSNIDFEHVYALLNEAVSAWDEKKSSSRRLSSLKFQ